MITIEKSEELLNGLDRFYKAILPSEKFQRRKNLQIMATEEDTFHRNVSKPFLDYMRLKIVQDIRRAVIKAKTTPTIFTEYVDWEDISTKGKQLSKPAYIKILDKSGTQAAIVARVEAGFDVMNVNSIKWAEKYSAAMVTEVTKETKKALREVISDGMKQKWNKLKIARQINKMPIGLSLPQTQALHNFRDKLMTEGVSAKLVEKRVQSYYNRLLRQRSRSIARTETSRAVNEGYLQGLEQQNVYKKVRISMAADACHLCTEHSGRIFTLEEAHAFLPIHPFCRCAWVVVWSKRPAALPRIPIAPQSPEATAVREKWLKEHEETQEAIKKIRSQMETGPEWAKYKKLEASMDNLRHVAYNDPMKVKLRGEIDDAYRAYNKKYQALRARELTLQGKANEALYVSKEGWVPRNVRYDVGGIVGDEGIVVTAEMKTKLEPVVKKLSKYFKKEVWDYDLDPMLCVTKKSRVFCSGGSAHFNASVSIKELESQIFHEVGHALEYSNKALRVKVKAFYSKRTAGEAPVWLGEGFGQHEITKVDKFMNKYMGKMYGEGAMDATEITSMGVQCILEKPIEFAAKDPEYFDLMIGILRGY